MNFALSQKTAMRHPNPVKTRPTNSDSLAPLGQAAMQAAWDLLSHLVWTSSANGVAGWSNTAWKDFTDTPASCWINAVHAQDTASAQNAWDTACAAHASFQRELRLRNRSGEQQWFLVAAQFHPGGSDDQAGYWVFTGTDIHERMRARAALNESLLMQETMLNASVDCIKIVLPDGTLAHMNHAGCRALGVSPESGFGMKWLDLLPAEFRDPGLRALRQALRGRNARFAGKSAAPGMPPQYWDNILTPVQDDSGRTVSILCVSRDVTTQQEAEERLRKVSEIDELTDLPNRVAFKSQLKTTLAHARSESETVLLMLLGLDHFRHLNDSLGHVAGDHLLQVVARRVQSCLTASATVARMGGDEFAIVVPDVQDNAEITRIANRVMAQLDAPIHFDSQRINGSMSIGCALYPRDARDADLLLTHADAALSDMKASGRGGVRIYSADILRPLQEEARQFDQARRILRERSLTPYYQPKFQLSDRKLVGMEALLRSHGADTTVLGKPSTVQAAFRDYDLATRIAEALRARVFADMHGWLQSGLPLVPVSINASPVEFMRGNFADRLLKQMNKAQIPPTLIELEVTEDRLDERGSQHMIRALEQLRREGMRVALDDFGTGHSSLTRLHSFPVDCLKIDGNFVTLFGRDPAITAVVNAIGQIAAALSLTLVAEGIETELQRQLLIAAGFQIGQGHLFSEAVSAQEIAVQLLSASGKGTANENSA